MDISRHAVAPSGHLLATRRRAASVAALAAVALTCAIPPAHAAPGALDATFGSGGIVLTDPGTSELEGLAVQPDGKAVVLDSGSGSQHVLRFLGDGTPDPSFGSAGVADAFDSPDFYARALALQADGKILVAGYDSAHDFAVARLMPDGKLDPAFDGDSGNANGVVHTAITPSDDDPNSVAVDQQGRIVVAGIAGINDIGIVRYLPDGKLDKSLAGDGTMVDITPPTAETVTASALTADGILVAGGDGSNSYVARYTAQGAVDTAFGKFGRTVVSADPGPDEAQALAVQSDGTIVVGACTGDPGNNPPDRLVALTPGGGLDTSFANGGKPEVQLDHLDAIALTRNDKIAVVGDGTLNGSESQALELRNADGTSDTTFASGDPILNLPSTISNGYALKVAVTPDGKLVVGALDDDPALKTKLLALTRYQVDPDPAGGPTDGNTAPAPPVAQPPGPLALSDLTLTHRTFAVGRTSTRAVGTAQAARSRSRGTAFAFTLNRASTVTIRIKRLHHASPVVKLKRTSRAGRNRVRFSGRVGRRALHTGHYRATLTAIDASGARSNTKTITFQIVRR